MTDATETLSLEVDPQKRRRWNCNLGAFSYPDFLLYWIGMVISFTGSWAQSLAMAWLVMDLTNKGDYAAHQGLYLGLVTACSTVPFLALALPAGVIADRFSKRKITLITQSLAMVQAALLGLLAYADMIHIWHILVLALFSGIVSAIDVPARHAMTAELVDKEDLTNAVALGSLAFNGARIIGPALGGFLLYKYGAAMCFSVNALSFIAAIVALALIRPVRLIRRPTEHNMLHEVREGLRYSVSNTLVRDLLLMTLIVCIFGTQYATVMPIWVKHILHKNAKVLGIMMSATGVGAALGAIFVAFIGRALKQGKLVLIGAFLLSGSLLLFSRSNSVLISAILLGFVGFGMMLFLSVSNSLIQITSPDVLRGRVLSIRSLLFIGVAPPIGGLLMGYLTDHAGVRSSVFLAGVVCLLTGLAFTLTSKAVRRA
ncbi:MAG: MFS transporter [Armatimonadetes bacterium]|nr:MFS transporter [Armatimonadota bacterium]